MTSSPMRKAKRAGPCLLFIAMMAAAPAPRASEVPEEALTTLAWQIAREETLVAPDQLAQWIVEDRAGLVLIDVRSPEDYAAGHIQGAHNIALPVLLEPETMRRLAEEETVVVYSNSGTRAAQSVAVLRLSQVPASSLVGGYRLWLDRVLDPQTALPPGEEIDLAMRQAIGRRMKNCPPPTVAAMPLCETPGAAAPAATVVSPPGPSVVAPPGATEQPETQAPAAVPLILEGACG